MELCLNEIQILYVKEKGEADLNWEGREGSQLVLAQTHPLSQSLFAPA